MRFMLTVGVGLPLLCRLLHDWRKVYPIGDNINHAHRDYWECNRCGARRIEGITELDSCDLVWVAGELLPEIVR